MKEPKGKGTTRTKPFVYTRSRDVVRTFRTGTTRDGEFLSPGVASSPAISPRRKLREEYQHATLRCRCGDFSPRFRIYEAASFLTSGHEREEAPYTMLQNPGN